MPSQFASSLDAVTPRQRVTWIQRVETHMDETSYADLCGALADQRVPPTTIHRALVALNLPYCPAESTVLNTARAIRERA